MSGKELLKRICALLYFSLYRYCYATGLYTLQTVSGLCEFTQFCTGKTKRQVLGAFARLGRRIGLSLRRYTASLRRTRLHALRALCSFCASLRQLRRGAPADSAHLLKAAFSELWAFLWPIVKTILNHALPVVAAVVCFRFVAQVAATDYGLLVTIKNETVGVISGEEVYDSAAAMVREKLQGISGFEPTDLPMRFELVPKRGPLIDSFTLSDTIIAASGRDLQTAYGLYIDNAFQGAVDDKGQLLKLLARMQDRHLSGALNETVHFVRPVTVREGLYPRQNVKSAVRLAGEIDRQVGNEFTYTAKPGDTPTGIAAQFGMTLQELEKNNSDLRTNLPVGRALTISRAQPFLSVGLNRIEEYEEELPFSTEKIEDDSLFTGETKTIQEGETGTNALRAMVTYIDNTETDREILSAKEIKAPVPKKIAVGTKAKPKPTPLPQPAYSAPAGGAPAKLPNSSGSGRISGGFIPPVQSGNVYVSNFFGGYAGYRYAHGAYDYAAAYGTPIYASASGTVTYSAYTVWGYGRHIIIDHGNGVQTLYAHNSQNAVSTGQYVQQGQIIGYVGRTGNATGNHCHFEIRVNGAKINPGNYLG